MHIQLITQAHPLRPKIEGVTQDVYGQAYDAHIANFPELMLCLLDPNGDALCSVGLRKCHEGFYCEHYLDLPLEDHIFALSAQMVARDKIIEVSNLASCSRKHLLQLLFKVIEHCLNLEMECAVFTATSRLRAALKCLRLPFDEIAIATGEALETDHSWGHYYDTFPSVCIVQRGDLMNSSYFMTRTKKEEHVHTV
jgi:hypothetical protein